MDEVSSLADLHDIIVPEGPPFWPPADGFWILIFLTVVLLVSVWRQYRSLQRRNAYRQAGLLLLKEAVSVHDVSVILKRVALAAWPRERVASLHGHEWVQFLNSHCRGGRFDDNALEPAQAADQALVKSAAHWIRRHRVGKEAADG